MVEPELDFVAMAAERPTLFERLHLKMRNNHVASQPIEIMLISSPGFGVLESGRGRTIVGKATLQEFERLWKQQGIMVPQPMSEVHQFRLAMVMCKHPPNRSVFLYGLLEDEVPFVPLS